ncbi:MAG: HlyC/CorC family transporter [Calditrichaeota bacterium]|nr:HlyC/CorC family transporter [Calditrichota bacterium]
MSSLEIHLGLIFFALLMSAYFSGTETVFLSASRLRSEILFRRRVKSIRRIYHFISKPETFIVTTLVGTNLSSVLFSTLVVLSLKNSVDEFVIVLISTSALLLFGEIIPKSLGQEFSNQLLPLTGALLKIFKFLFAPVNFLLLGFTNFFLKRLNLKTQADFQTVFTRKDIVRVLRESEKGGAIKSKESRLIGRIFDLRKTRLKDSMVPRTEIVAVPKNISIERLSTAFSKSGFSRLPVYEDSIDNIIGIVYAKDLLTEPESLREILKEPIFVPDSKPAFRLLVEFKQKKMSIAIVLDEYGGTAGLITVEDLVEELVGEIYDEFDIDHEKMYRRLNANTISIDARAEIDEINEKFNLNLPEQESYSTIGGFVIEQLGHIAKEGEVLDTERYRIKIEKADQRRVIRVRLIKK